MSVLFEITTGAFYITLRQFVLGGAWKICENISFTKGIRWLPVYISLL